MLASIPWRRVPGTFSKKPRPAIKLATLIMSSVEFVRNNAVFQSNFPPYNGRLWRSPASYVVATTCFSGGSDTRKFSSRHGLAGLEQESSSGVGARFDWE